MAELTLGGVTYRIAPLKLRELRLAAPYIDRLGARAGKLDGVAAVAETAADMLAVMVVGMADVTLESLQTQVSLEDLDALRRAFDEVMAEAGLKRPAVAGGASPGEPQGANVVAP